MDNVIKKIVREELSELMDKKEEKPEEKPEKVQAKSSFNKRPANRMEQKLSGLLNKIRRKTNSVETKKKRVKFKSNGRGTTRLRDLIN